MHTDLLGNSLMFFSFMLLGAIGAAFLGTLAIKRYWLFKTRAPNNSEQFSIDFLISVLSSCPNQWIVWIPSSQTFLYDHGAQKKLNLPANGNASLEEVCRCFSQFSADLLKRCLMEFNPDDKPSEISLELQSGSGIELQFHSTRDDKYVVLWMQSTLGTADQEKREHNKNWRDLCLQLPFPIWHRQQSNEITSGNAQYQKLISQNPTLSDFLHQSGPIIHPSKKEIMQDESLQEYLLFEHPLLEETGHIGYAFEISKLNSDTLNKNQNLTEIHDLFNQMPLGVVIYDADKKLNFFNTAYSQMFKLDTEWLKQKPEFSDVLDHLHHRRLITEQADFPAYKNSLLQMFDHFATPKQELIHLPDERSLRMLVAPFGKSGLFFVFENITEQLVLERKANVQESVNQDALERLQEGIIVFAGDNRLKLANKSFADLWRLSEHSLSSGRHISEIMDDMREQFCYGQSWERYKQHLIESLTNRTPKTGELTRKDGTILAFTYVPLPDGTNMLSYFDVTNSKRIHKALIERAKAFEVADELKSEFLSNITNTLKAPLDTITGFTEIMLNQYFGRLNSQQMAYSKAIYKAAHSLLQNMKTIIDFSELKAGKVCLNLQPVDLKHFLYSLVSAAQDISEMDGTQITMSFSTEIQHVVADEWRLKQALLGIIANALHSIPKNGQIRIEVTTDLTHILINISDNGFGIPQNDHSKLFEPFARTQKSNQYYAGTGVGLSLSQGIIEMHQGEISITSAPNQGTTVVCKLPLSLPQSAQRTLPKIA